MQPHIRQDNPTFGFDAFDLAHRMLNEGSGPPVRPEDFSSYHFLDNHPVGSGALGDVWLAEEQGKLGAERKVAVKLLRNLSRPDLAANEIKSQAKLEHRHIVRLYNHGVLNDGTVWLAMEFVEGEPLDEYCKNHHCSMEQRLLLFHSICEAVSYAHSQMVDHGDLKPSNILVKADGEPKLVDFGFARRLHATGDAAAHAPVLGLTPGYAAPEQFLGESPGFRGDIYALGVILYELLSGEHPFDISKHSFAEIESLKTGSHQREPPSAIAKRTSASSRDRLSDSQWRDLDALCRKAMDSDAGQRYSSVEALLHDLDRYLRSEPLAARLPHTRAYRAGKFLRRNRTAVVASSLVFAAIALIVTASIVRIANARNQALAEAARTRRIQQFMLDLFGNGDQQAAPGKDLTVLAAIDRGAASIASLSSDPDTQAELYLTLGRMYDQLNQFSKAGELLQRGLEKSEAVGAETTRTVSALVQLGLLRGDQAQTAEAEKLIRQALDLAHRLRLKPNDPLLVNAESSLGKVLVQAGSYDKAIAILEPLVRQSPSSEEETVNLTETLTDLGVAQQYKGNYEAAESANRRALDLDRKVHGNLHPRVAEDLSNIATTKTTTGKYAEAEVLYRQAVAIDESWYGPDNPEVLQMKTMLALTAMQSGKDAEAEKLLRNILPLQERAYGSVHPVLAFTHDVLGKLAEKREDLATAEVEFSRGFEINRQLFGVKEYRTAISANNLSGVLLKEHHYARGEALLRPAVQVLTEKPLPGNMSVGLAELNLGESLLRQNRYQEAIAPLSAAYELLNGGSDTVAKRREVARQY
ncbi:MAG: tetratricopeptide repeat protein, partial [Bryobacterales bacterium]|nr:tetratricopeptide repeat protein [Bryobacterales bacterium]